MDGTYTELAIDRIIGRLKKINSQLNIFVFELEKSGGCPEYILEKAVAFKEEFVDLLTLAERWRTLAEMNGVDLDTDGKNKRMAGLLSQIGHLANEALINPHKRDDRRVLEMIREIAGSLE